MMDALARLHKVDYRAVGLADYGKPGSYFARQIAPLDQAMGGLAAPTGAPTRPSTSSSNGCRSNIPEGDDETVICHGDFRFDNMMFHETEPRVIGIFDWELSTLGHPLADLAYVCIRHNMPPGMYDGLDGARPRRARHSAAGGIHRRLQASAPGAAATSRRSTSPSALFRLAVILEGVLARARAGNASNCLGDQHGPDRDAARRPRLGDRRLIHD